MNNYNINLHCTVMLTFILWLPILLLAEHEYTPVSSLEAFVIVKFKLTLVTFPLLVRVLKLSLTDTWLLKIPLVLLHTVVGGGKPVASHVTVVAFPSSIIELNIGLTLAISVQYIIIIHETDVSIW